jgi:hypothetical protein
VHVLSDLLFNVVFLAACMLLELRFAGGAGVHKTQVVCTLLEMKRQQQND